MYAGFSKPRGDSVHEISVMAVVYGAEMIVPSIILTFAPAASLISI